MKAQKECFECLKNQAKAHNVELKHYEELLDEIPKDECGASLFLTPPQIAISLYGRLSKDLGKSDVFAEVKSQSIQKVYQLISRLDIERLSLQEALKLSALGNVIDYGSSSVFCIENFDFTQELANLDFACFDFKPFLDILSRANRLVILGDNAGENLLDEILLRVLKQERPSLELYYFVRGEPIINDITMADLSRHRECQEIFEVAKVIDSGVKSAGFVLDDSSQEAQEIFQNADLVLSKGMGNFECLNESQKENLFFLMKIKCQIVAKTVGFPLGKMVFKQNTARIC